MDVHGEDLVVGGEGDRHGRLVPGFQAHDALDKPLEELPRLHHHLAVPRFSNLICEQTHAYARERG